MQAVGRRCRHVVFRKESAQAFRIQEIECRLYESSVATECSHECIGGERVGYVAASAAGGEQLKPRLWHLFEEQDVRAASGRGYRRHQPGGSGTDNEDPPVAMSCLVLMHERGE